MSPGLCGGPVLIIVGVLSLDKPRKVSTHRSANIKDKNMEDIELDLSQLRLDIREEQNALRQQKDV